MALVCQRVFDRFAQVVRGLVAAAFVALLLPEGRSPLVAAVGRAHPRAPGPQPPQSVARVHGGGHACERGPPAGAPRLAWLPEGCAPPRARVAGMVRPAIRRRAQRAARPTSSCDPDRAKRILLLPQRTPLPQEATMNRLAKTLLATAAVAAFAAPVAAQASQGADDPAGHVRQESRQTVAAPASATPSTPPPRRPPTTTAVTAVPPRSPSRPPCRRQRRPAPRPPGRRQQPRDRAPRPRHRRRPQPQLGPSPLPPPAGSRPGTPRTAAGPSAVRSHEALHGPRPSQWWWPPTRRPRRRRAPTPGSRPSAWPRRRGAGRPRQRTSRGASASDAGSSLKRPSASVAERGSTRRARGHDRSASAGRLTGFMPGGHAAR